MVNYDTLHNSNNFLLRINGVNLSQNVSAFDFNHQDIHSSDTGRNDSGVMQLDVVREDVKDLSVKWSFLTPAQKHQILDALQASSTFQAEWFDGEGYGDITVQAYRGNIGEHLRFKDDSSSYWEIDFKLIEL